MAESRSRARQSISRDMGELVRRVRAADGEAAVRHHDGRDDRGHEHPEQGERQGIPDEIEKEEAAAGPAYVPNEARQIFGRQVMSEVHGEGQIRDRERIANRVRANDRKGRIGLRRRIQIDADGLGAKPPLNVTQDTAASATNIEDPAHRL